MNREFSYKATAILNIAEIGVAITLGDIFSESRLL
jgi:hypothetical protein